MNNEQDILRRAQQGDSEAFRLLVEAYQTQVYRLALRMCRRSGGRRRDTGGISCRVAGTAGVPRHLPLFHMALSPDHQRRHRLAPPGEAPSGHGRRHRAGAAGRWSQPAGPGRAGGSTAGRPPCAVPAVRGAPGRSWLLRYMQELDYAEIAAALEISEGTVKSRISRAKMRLRELLDGSGNLFDGGAVLQTEISERREQP